MSDTVVVIPVFNEAPTIASIVARARRHGSVLVVDDGSTDGGGAAAARAGADLLRLGRRSGKGAALRRGFAEALARGAERVVTLDGDGQHDPDEIPRLLETAAGAPETVVIGGRLTSTSDDDRLPRERLNAMRVAGFFIDWLTGTPLRDTQSGFRVYPGSLLAVVVPRRGGFVLETEMLLRAAEGGWSLVETPITPVPAAARQSRFRPWADGVAVGLFLAARVLLRWGREAGAAARSLVGPFQPARRAARHREAAAFAAPYRHTPGAWAAMIGLFMLQRTVDTWRGWWTDPRARALRVVGVATVATPLLALLALASPVLGRIGVDAITPFVRAVYSQQRLAAALLALRLSRARTP